MAESGDITVKVGKVPGTMKVVKLPASAATVCTALEQAGITDHENYELRVNLSAVGLDQELEDGQAVLLLSKIKGN